MVSLAGCGDARTCSIAWGDNFKQFFRGLGSWAVSLFVRKDDSCGWRHPLESTKLEVLVGVWAGDVLCKCKPIDHVLLNAIHTGVFSLSWTWEVLFEATGKHSAALCPEYWILFLKACCKLTTWWKLVSITTTEDCTKLKAAHQLKKYSIAQRRQI